MGIFSFREADLSAKERNQLDDSQFGLPEDRKYPLNDGAHVRSAIKLFGHCPEDKRSRLAKNIRKAAKKFNVDINPDSLVAKYLHESYITESAATKKYPCPYCGKYDIRDKLVSHIEKKHDDLLPKGYSASRIVFDVVNHKEVGNGYGTCRVCHNHTSWNEKTGKYNVLCDNPACRKALRDRAKNNMIKVYGKPMLLDDPEQQQKMLANRGISGVYTFQDGGKFTYTGSYEKKALEFLDQVLEVSSEDLIVPGPTLEYEFQGEKRHWITDIYYIPYNLVIEVKDGGDNPNRRDMPIYRAKQYAKEEMITSLGKFNYLRLTDNNFSQLLYIMAELKADMMDVSDPKDIKTKIRINENAVVGSVPIPNTLYAGDDPETNRLFLINYLQKNTFGEEESKYAIASDIISKNVLYYDEKKRKRVIAPYDKVIENVVSIYEFVGDRDYDLYKRIHNLQNTGVITQTDDPILRIFLGDYHVMLSPDQLDYEKAFRRVDIQNYLDDIDEVKQSLIHEFTCIQDPTKRGLPVLELAKYEKTAYIARESAGRFDILEDIDGYYVTDSKRRVRSKSYKDFNEAVQYY